MMKPAKPESIFDPADDIEEARLDAVADAEIEGGQFVTHNRVVGWLRSWEKAEKLPDPTPEPR